MSPRGSRARKTDGDPREEPGTIEPRRDGSGEVGRPGEDPDVLLDVPTLNVEEIDLAVEELRAHVSVRAELVDFLNINVGVDAYLDGVKLNIKGVEAQVLLKVRLERIVGAIERALEVIQRNPDLLDPASRETARGDEGTEGSGGATGARELEGGGGSGEAGRAEATPAARRRAEELGVDLSTIEGTGSGGRILYRDVEKAARG